MFIYIDIYKYIKRLLPIATLCIKESDFKLCLWFYHTLKWHRGARVGKAPWFVLHLGDLG